MLIAIKVLGLQAFGSYPDVDIVCPCLPFECPKAKQLSSQPRYMKVDVEGHDLDCVSSLANVSRPRFFSIELPPAEEVAELADVFRRF